MLNVFLLTVVIAVFWGGWPLVVRATGGTPGNLGNLLLVLLASLPALALLAIKGTTPMPENSWYKMIIAGIMMGLGLVLFNQYLATNTKVEISTIVPILNTAMIMVTVAGGIIFFGEAITAQKILGIITLAVGIYMLKPV